MMDASPFLDFYLKFHEAAAVSEANALFCERVYGKNLCQQGFAEMTHLDHLIQVTGIQAGQQVLDLGCGNGMIAEYISDRTGAAVTGVDFIQGAIHTAETRTQAKRVRLNFRVMDIAQLAFPRASFDVILSIDTLYFSDLDDSLSRMVQTLKPSGRMGIFFNQTCPPWVDLETFPRESVHPDRTDLAQALRGMHLPYQVWDYSRQDYEHAQRRKVVLAELKPLYEKEDRLFLYESYEGEANGVSHAYENGVHGRYLYRVDLAT
ncbi:MAG: class I SAM-dependent methyltransferase [Anaerolineales bacterium]|nr:class I SAM-dependent methyltransferase [Anaerolineales bacterium]